MHLHSSLQNLKGAQSAWQQNQNTPHITLIETVVEQNHNNKYIDKIELKNWAAPVRCKRRLK